MESCIGQAPPDGGVGILLDCRGCMLGLEIFSLWKELEMRKVLIVIVLTVGARRCVQPVICGLLCLILTQPI